MKKNNSLDDLINYYIKDNNITFSNLIYLHNDILNFYYENLKEDILTPLKPIDYNFHKKIKNVKGIKEIKKIKNVNYSLKNEEFREYIRKLHSIWYNYTYDNNYEKIDEKENPIEYKKYEKKLKEDRIIILDNKKIFKNQYENCYNAYKYILFLKENNKEIKDNRKLTDYFINLLEGIQ